MCSLSSIAHPSVCAHTHRHARGESTTQLLKIGSCCSVLLSIPHSGCHFDSVSLGHIWLAGYQRTCGGMEGCYKGRSQKYIKTISKVNFIYSSPPHHPPTPHCHPAHNLMLWKYGPIQSHILWLSSRDCLFAE